MTQRYEPTPRPEELAAYFDGELSGAQRRRVEAWLADHPCSQSDLEEWQHLAQLAEITRPADPGESTWRGTFARIESALPPPRRGWHIARTAAALAACLALAFYLAPSGEPPAEELVLATAADVEIISMDAADVSALVVGRPPLHEPLVLAESADIHFESIEPDHDGSMPAVRWWVDDDAPMIVAIAER